MFYNLFLYFPFFTALFWVVVLLLDNNKNNSKRFLTFFLTLSTINYFIHMLYFSKEYELYKYLESVWMFTSLVGYPLYYYYIRLLTKDVKINWKWVWLLFPAFFLSFYTAIIYLLMSQAEADYFIHNIMYNETYPIPKNVEWLNWQIFHLKAFKVVFAIEIVGSVFWGIRLINEYNKKITDNYSTVDDKHLGNIKWVIGAFLTASFVSLFSNGLGKDYFIQYPLLIFLPSTTHSFYLFLIGYAGYKQNFTIEHFNEDYTSYLEKQKTDKKRVQEEYTDIDRLYEELMVLFTKEELYKNANLRITDIAIMLNTNRTYISKIFNEKLQMSFSEYVNNHRVDYAEKLLKSSSCRNLKMVEVAENSGFYSESTFYRKFKDKVGVSPGKFKEQYHNKE